MAELLDSLGRAADRLELSYSETGHIVRNGAWTIRRLREAVALLMNGMGGHHHWDAAGTNGLNCDTCRRQREAMFEAAELL